MDLSPLLLIVAVTVFIVTLVYIIEKCPHRWESIQEGKNPNGKKYQIRRCTICDHFEKLEE